ncbi:hypothetical protein ASD54_21565 [Rhizobium sp. Root149]|uniref:hypothetical protein n=1 Tax=Rhizobium sp. Root149 TaxID=1736473 RepID=UPI0007127643|nr:hypothetical protein [Rhizobium sp. Root149]KQZ46613.1 hypothetical protein ASD54_21565 [Rhizobium sp. Root149]
MTRQARWSIWIAVGAAVSLFVGANAHLVYVAIRSQPGCVDHLKTRGTDPGQFRAAKSAC